MKLSQDQVMLAGLVIGILVLGGIVFFLVNQKNSGVGVGATFAKTFSSDVHAGLLDMNSQMSELIIEIEGNAPPQGFETEYVRLYALAVSNQEEAVWMLEKENPVFEKLQKTENNAEALELLSSETALFVLATHLSTIQENLVEILADENAVPDETIALAEEEIPNIQIKNFVSPENVKTIAEQTGLTEAQIRTANAKLMGEYIEYKKTRFATETLESFRLVEANKLLAWRYILESLPDQ